jgi:hypothetical protein
MADSRRLSLGCVFALCICASAFAQTTAPETHAQDAQRFINDKLAV